ncbi:MAG: trehalose phosphatase, partial [Mycobacterium sp. 20-66-4]
MEPDTVDPRRHDAVLLEHADSAQPLIARLQQAGVLVGVVASSGNRQDLIEAADALGTRAGRSVVIATDAAGVTAAREAGFALVIGVDSTGRGDELRRLGADAVVADPGEVTVRTGDRRMSQLPDALRALDDGLPAGRPAVFFDFDGTLSDIVNDPGSARLVAGAGEALRQLAAQCPVAVLSGRD